MVFQFTFLLIFHILYTFLKEINKIDRIFCWPRHRISKRWRFSDPEEKGSRRVIYTVMFYRKIAAPDDKSASAHVTCLERTCHFARDFAVPSKYTHVYTFIHLFMLQSKLFMCPYFFFSDFPPFFKNDAYTEIIQFNI